MGKNMSLQFRVGQWYMFCEQKNFSLVCVFYVGESQSKETCDFYQISLD